MKSYYEFEKHEQEQVARYAQVKLESRTNKRRAIAQNKLELGVEDYESARIEE